MLRPSPTIIAPMVDRAREIAVRMLSQGPPTNIRARGVFATPTWRTRSLLLPG